MDYLTPFTSLVGFSSHPLLNLTATLFSDSPFIFGPHATCNPVCRRPCSWIEIWAKNRFSDGPPFLQRAALLSCCTAPSSGDQSQTPGSPNTALPPCLLIHGSVIIKERLHSPWSKPHFCSRLDASYDSSAS